MRHTRSLAGRWVALVLPLYRLIAVLLITVFCVCRLIVACLIKGWTPQRVSHHASCWASVLVRHLNIDVTVNGTVPENGVMIVANHRSYLDIVVILSQVQAAFLAKQELRSWPVFGYAAMKGNTVFVDRSSRTSRETSRHELLKRLQQGICVVVFPEGTTSEGPGLLDFHKGVFHLAAQQGVHTVPAAVCYENREAAWIGDDTFVPHFLRIFRNRRLNADLTFGPVFSEQPADILREDCHRTIHDALLRRESMEAA